MRASLAFLLRTVRARAERRAIEQWKRQTMTDPAPETPAALVRAFLATLMKAALTSDDRHGFAWRREAAGLRTAIAAADPAALEPLKIDGLWWLAVGDAEVPELQAEEGKIEWGQPKTCPFGLAEIAAPDFDIDVAVQHLRETAATG